MILLFTILFNGLEAFYEALYDNGQKMFSGIVEAIHKLGIVVTLAWLTQNNYGDKDLISLVIAFFLVRHLVFNPIYNLVRGLNIFYIGNTKLFDKIMGHFGIIPFVISQFISGFLGIIYLI